MTSSSSSSSSSPQSPSPPHQYPAAIQLKLYQAFIFSIPILFSIILFLLFYLFYLKRRASSFSSTGPLLPRTINAAPCDLALKNELKTKLCKILFDESIKAGESTCCVCLGEFEVQEELLQVPSCKHIFHIECIRLWLRSNSTCPLCRAPVISDHTNCKSHHHHLQESQAAPPPPAPEHTSVVRFQGSSSASGGTTC